MGPRRPGTSQEDLHPLDWLPGVRTPHTHNHYFAPQLVGLHHIQLPLVLDLDDLQQLGLPTPGGHSLCPALDSPAGVCRHVLPVELLADVGVNVALEPGLGHLPVHVPVGTAHLAAHDQVISVKAACWPAWTLLASASNMIF